MIKNWYTNISPSGCSYFMILIKQKYGKKLYNRRKRLSEIDKFLLFKRVLKPVLEIRVFLARILWIADPGSLGQGSGGSGSLKNISNINKCLS